MGIHSWVWKYLLVSEIRVHVHHAYLLSLSGCHWLPSCNGGWKPIRIYID